MNFLNLDESDRKKSNQNAYDPQMNLFVNLQKNLKKNNQKHFEYMKSAQKNLRVHKKYYYNQEETKEHYITEVSSDEDNDDPLSVVEYQSKYLLENESVAKDQDQIILNMYLHDNVFKRRLSVSQLKNLQFKLHPSVISTKDVHNFPSRPHGVSKDYDVDIEDLDYVTKRPVKQEAFNAVDHIRRNILYRDSDNVKRVAIGDNEPQSFGRVDNSPNKRRNRAVRSPSLAILMAKCDQLANMIVDSEESEPAKSDQEEQKSESTEENDMVIEDPLNYFTQAYAYYRVKDNTPVLTHIKSSVMSVISRKSSKETAYFEAKWQPGNIDYEYYHEFKKKNRVHLVYFERQGNWIQPDYKKLLAKETLTNPKPKFKVDHRPPQLMKVVEEMDIVKLHSNHQKNQNFSPMISDNLNRMNSKDTIKNYLGNQINSKVRGSELRSEMKSSFKSSMISNGMKDPEYNESENNYDPTKKAIARLLAEKTTKGSGNQSINSSKSNSILVTYNEMKDESFMNEKYNKPNASKGFKTCYSTSNKRKK